MATPDSLGLAAEGVAAYVSNNPVPKGDLPDLVLAVLARLGSEPELAVPQVEAKAPAVPIRKSVTPDCLICLDDGKIQVSAPSSGVAWTDAIAVSREMEAAF